MITVYFIDEYHSKNNGLETYNNVISNGISSKNIQFINVYVNSNVSKGVYKKFKNGTYQLYIPVLPRKSSNFEVYKCLESDMMGKQDVIVHFNWISHLPIAWFFKKYTHHITLFTSHCISWRDFVTDDFDQFYRMDAKFQSNEKFDELLPSIAKEKILYESIDHFIVLTNVAKKSLIFLEVSVRKISIIRNGTNLDEEIENRLGKKENLRIKYGLSPLDRVLLYVGKVTKRKGIIDLIEAFEKLLDANPFDNIKLIVIGDGEHSQAIKTSKKYWSQIIYTGPLNKDQIYDFYTLADIGIVPSYIEQCSYTAIEMMMFSLPLIVSNIDGLSEMVKNDSGLKTPINFVMSKGASLDIDILCNNISNFLYDKDLRTKMATKAKKDAQNMFSRQKMVNSHMELYKKMCHGKQKHITNLTGRNNLIFGHKSNVPKVSVVVLCHKNQNYLNECLESIFGQTYQDFELILMNDKSYNKGKEIVNNFSDSRLVYVENVKKLDATDSLNKAIIKAKGKYITIIDSDDMMAPKRLELQVSFLDKHAGCGLVGCSYELIDEYGMVFNRIDLPRCSKELKLDILFKNQLIHSSVTMRTELALRFNYSNEFTYCEDYDLWTKISKVSKVACLPEHLISHRIHSDNTLLINYETMKKNRLLLISRELSSLNIPHTSQDLMIHSAIIFGNTDRIFNNKYGKMMFRNWIDRILYSKVIMEHYNQEFVDKYRSKILERNKITSI